ncbi:MAG: MFS transporter [Acidipropionibacterium sp.]|nr:MFS transporter [Acidipropionibacterium sp.]
MSRIRTRSGDRRRSPLADLALPIYLPSIVWATSYGALTAVMVLAALQIGFGPTLASAVAGISGLVGVVTGPWVGREITRFGDRPAFVAGTLIAVLALLAGLASLHWHGQGWAQPVYLVAIVVLSVSNNIWSLARQSYVAESVPIAMRARALSMLGGMQRMGQVIGPAVGSVAIARWSYPGSFWVQIAMALAALAFVLVFTLPTPEMLGQDAGRAAESDTGEGEAGPDGTGPDRTGLGGAGDRGHSVGGTDAHHSQVAAPPARVREHADPGATAMLAVATILLTIVRANRNVVIPLWGHALGIAPHTITATFAASAVMDSLVFYPSGRLSDRFGRRASLVPTLLIMGVGFVGLVTWQSLTGFVVCACVIGLGNGFGAGIVMTMGADLSPDVDRSTFLGMWQSVQQAGMTAGPFIVTGMVAGFGVGASVWVTGLLSLAGVGYVLATVPRAYARMGLDDRGRALVRR